jgi:hypothetical protein
MTAIGRTVDRRDRGGGPRALQGALPVRKAPDGLQLAVDGDSFDPASADRRFTIAVNNYAAIIAVGPIVAAAAGASTEGAAVVGAKRHARAARLSVLVPFPDGVRTNSLSCKAWRNRFSAWPTAGWLTARAEAGSRGLPTAKTSRSLKRSLTPLPLLT